MANEGSLLNLSVNLRESQSLFKFKSMISRQKVQVILKFSGQLVVLICPILSIFLPHSSTRTQINFSRPGGNSNAYSGDVNGFILPNI